MSLTEEQMAEVVSIHEEHSSGGQRTVCGRVSAEIERVLGFPKVMGFYVGTINGRRLWTAHAWNLLPDGRVLDATCDQFGLDAIRISDGQDYAPFTPEQEEWMEQFRRENWREPNMEDWAFWQWEGARRTAADKTAARPGVPVISWQPRESGHSATGIVSGERGPVIAYRGFGSWGEARDSLREGRWRSKGMFTVPTEGETQMALDLNDVLHQGRGVHRLRGTGFLGFIEADIAGLPFATFVSRFEPNPIDETRGVIYPDTGLGIGIEGGIPLDRIRRVVALGEDGSWNEFGVSDLRQNIDHLQDREGWRPEVKDQPDTHRVVILVGRQFYHLTEDQKTTVCGVRPVTLDIMQKALVRRGDLLAGGQITDEWSGKTLDPGRPCPGCSWAGWVQLAKTAMPTSWRPFEAEPTGTYDAVIATEFNGRKRVYEVYTYGVAFGDYHSLVEAKAALEAIYGPLAWQRRSLVPVEVNTVAWGPTEEFTAPRTVYTATLPRLAPDVLAARVAAVEGVSKTASIIPESLPLYLSFVARVDVETAIQYASEAYAESVLPAERFSEDRAREFLLQVLSEQGVDPENVTITFNPHEGYHGTHRGWGGQHAINISRRTDYTILHEAAHAISGAGRANAHGQPFFAAYRQLLDRYARRGKEFWVVMGSQAAALWNLHRKALDHDLLLHRMTLDGAREFARTSALVSTSFAKSLTWTEVPLDHTHLTGYTVWEAVHHGIRFHLEGNDKEPGKWSLQIYEPGDKVQIGLPWHHRTPDPHYDYDPDHGLIEGKSYFTSLAEAQQYVERALIASGVVDEMVGRDVFPQGSTRYHLTLARNVPSILRTGLDPRSQVGTGSSVFSNLKNASLILWDLKDEDWKAHQGEPLALLELDVSGMARSKIKSLVNEERVNALVSPERIRVLIPSIPWMLTESRFTIGYQWSDAEVLRYLKGDPEMVRRAWVGLPEELEKILASV